MTRKKSPTLLPGVPDLHVVRQDAPVLLKRARSPGFELLGEGLVETTDRTGTGSHSHECLRDLSHFMRARPSHKHLGQSFCNVGFVATVAVEGLSVKLTFPISRHVDVLKSTRRGHEIARVVAVAVPFAF